MSLSWEEFVAIHAPVVLRAATRILSNSADAEDAAQDVFIEVFQTRRFEQFHTQPGLIRILATRRSLDRLRRRKIWKGLDGGEVRTPSFEPHHYAIATELAEQLERELARLPPREAEVFCLVYFEECSHAEISRLLRISRGAVAKSLCLARDRLSTALGTAKSELSQ